MAEAGVSDVRFMEVDDEDVENFIHGQENPSTKKKTRLHVDFSCHFCKIVMVLTFQFINCLQMNWINICQTFWFLFGNMVVKNTSQAH